MPCRRSPTRCALSPPRPDLCSTASICASSSRPTLDELAPGSTLTAAPDADTSFAARCALYDASATAHARSGRTLSTPKTDAYAPVRATGNRSLRGAGATARHSVDPPRRPHRRRPRRLRPGQVEHVARALAALASCFEALQACCAQTVLRRCTTPLGLVQWVDRRSCYYAFCVRRPRHRQRIRCASSPLIYRRSTTASTTSRSTAQHTVVLRERDLVSDPEFGPTRLHRYRRPFSVLLCVHSLFS